MSINEVYRLGEDALANLFEINFTKYKPKTDNNLYNVIYFEAGAWYFFELKYLKENEEAIKEIQNYLGEKKQWK